MMLSLEYQFIINQCKQELLETNKNALFDCITKHGSTAVFIKCEKNSTPLLTNHNKFITISAFLYFIVKSKQGIAYEAILDSFKNIVSSPNKDAFSELINRIMSLNLLHLIFLKNILTSNEEATCIYEISNSFQAKSLEEICALLNCEINLFQFENNVFACKQYGKGNSLLINLFNSEIKGYAIIIDSDTSRSLCSQLYCESVANIPKELIPFHTIAEESPINTSLIFSGTLYSSISIESSAFVCNEKCLKHTRITKNCFSYKENKFVCPKCERKNMVICIGTITAWIKRRNYINCLKSKEGITKEVECKLQKAKQILEEQVEKSINEKVVAINLCKVNVAKTSNKINLCKENFKEMVKRYKLASPSAFHNPQDEIIKLLSKKQTIIKELIKISSSLSL